MKSHIDLSICIVSWNISDILKKCLHSIYQYSEDLNIEVIVFDNASTDDTLTMVETKFPQVKIIKSQTNIGFGRGNNAALKKSSGKYVLLLNPDIVIVEPCFRKLITFLETHTQFGIVGCKLVYADGRTQKSYFQSFPSLLSELRWGFMLHRIFDYFNKKSQNKSSSFEVAWLVGACMLFKHDVLSKLNGFDERYYLYGEDIDLCLRTSILGYKIYYMSNIKMMHHHGASSNRKKNRYFSAVLQKESRYKFMFVHYGIKKAAFYRFIWSIASIYRISILSIIYLTFFLFSSQENIQSLKVNFEKQIHILFWTLGLEKWVKQENLS